MDDRDVVRLLIVSDLHAEVSDASQDTRLLMKSDKGFSEGILKAVERYAGNVDYLVCSGDISNQSKPGSLEAGWGFVKELARRCDLDLARIIVTPGNHDHESRLGDRKYCPKHQMQYGLPDFPFDNHQDNTHFWAWNWVVREYDEFNLLVVNSSAYHGYSDEWSHGRVSMQATDAILSYINSESVSKKKFNILLTHHHPSKMDYVDESEDYEAIDGGDYLLENIQKTRKGPWLIIHGHKHYPDIKYAASRGAARPVVFSAGSLSAKLYPELERKTSNQFYIVEVNLNVTAANRLVTGQFRSYEWTMTSGWRESESDSLPDLGGFGGQLDMNLIIGKLEEVLDGGRLVASSSDLEGLNEYIRYLTPFDVNELIITLREEGYSAEVYRNEFLEVGRLNG